MGSSRRRVTEGRVNGKIRDDHKYKYMGLFIDDSAKSFNDAIDKLLKDKENSIERHKYKNVISDPHVTLRHESENKPFLEKFFNLKVPVKITHYGYDDDLGNEGVKIAFPNFTSLDPELQEMIKTNGKRIGGSGPDYLDKYHITLSIKNSAQAKNTKDIKNWQELKPTKTINMVMDGFVK